MKYSHTHTDSEEHLVEAINKISSQLCYRVEKNQSRHSDFLQEIIDDMEQELTLIRRGRRLTE
jgi:hypothetical protein